MVLNISRRVFQLAVLCEEFFMVPKFVGLLVCVLSMSAVACGREESLNIIEQPEFNQSSALVPDVEAEFTGRAISLKVFGLAGAHEAAQRDGWNRRLTVYFLSVPGRVHQNWWPLSVGTEIRIDYAQYQNSAELYNEQANRISRAQNVPILYLSPPAVFGSTGEYSDIYSASGIGFLNSAIDQLVEEFGADEVILVGQSSAGNIVGNLLPLRSDVGCAVISSAPLDLVAHEGFSSSHDHYLGAVSPLNPIEQVSLISPNDDRIVYVGYSETDQIVGPSYQIEYAQLLAASGHNVILQSAEAVDRWGHDVAVWRYNRMFECAREVGNE
ncbi:MAG: hypothetical protein P8P99_00295 [Maricaulis sp.]|nr:hypothetical protein [Maricaulis sp.]